MKIKLILDLCSDISPELIKSLNVGLITINVNTNGEYDMENFEPKTFCEFLRTCENIPKTSQPSPDDFISTFCKYKDDYDHVLYITMSPNGSGTYNSALTASNIYHEENQGAKVHVFNSTVTSLSMVILATKANDMINDGCGIDEIIEKLDEIKVKLSTYYLVNNVKFLAKSGRVSSVKGAIVTRLNIKPIIQIKDGVGGNPASTLGYERGIKKLADYYNEQGDKTETVYITHSDCLNNAKKLADKLKQVNKKIKVVITEMGYPMAVHSGPDCVGMFFLK